MATFEPTATIWPHGDQTAQTSDIAPTLAVHGSHEVEIPVTTFDTLEQNFSPYSFLTADEGGASTSAEW